MRKANIKAILFDKDGVLVDFQATYGGSTLEIISRLSNGDTEILNRLAEETGIRLEDGYIDIPIQYWLPEVLEKFVVSGLIFLGLQMTRHFNTE